ncbi:MAG: methyl-accepting chemotaxis protein [Oscillospiraceae bacterium]|jgi:methyl-accepting chemotaxis protein|nr:methyl-accepting chemotaxis protein [Oscillospiraceae bacterium]
MKNMTIRMKLITGFAIIFILLLIVGVVGLVGLSNMSDSTQTLYEKDSLALYYVGNIYNAFQRQRVITRDLVMYDDPTKLASLKSDLVAVEAIVDEQVALLGTISKSIPAQANTFNAFETSYRTTYNAIKQELIAYAGVDVPRAMVALEEGKEAAMNLQVLLDELSDEIIAEAKADNAANKALNNTLTVLIVGLVVLSALLAVLLTLYIATLIAKPIRRMVDAAKILAEGDINVSVESNSRDEVGEMATAFNHMVEGIKAQAKVVESIAAGDLRATVTPRSERDIINIGLRDMLQTNNEVFAEIIRSADNVSSGSKQVADGSQSLAQATTQQAAVVEELASSIGDVSEKTARNASMAQEASQLGQSINANAAKGNTQMSNMMQAVQEINEASQSISKVIKAIDDIAFQTNILALNAAVEAARAGQHGKGFAVVAEEVRSLAAKSAEAAKDTGGLIANSIEKAELGSHIAQETAQSLSEIVEGIQRSSAIVADIARLSDEQATAISQIDKGIDQVSQVVQANSATAEESAAASEEMSSQSVMLSELVGRFKLQEQSRSTHNHMSSLSHKVSAPRRPESSEEENDYRAASSGGYGKY